MSARGTESLEEHVAREIGRANIDFDNSPAMAARAAIAAVREWDNLHRSKSDGDGPG